MRMPVIRRALTFIAVVCVTLVYAPQASAEPTSTPVHVLYVRPYNLKGGTGFVIFQVDAAPLCGTDSYQIDLSWGGGKEAYAAVMTALLSGKRIGVEIDNAGCTGWGTKVQSIYVYAN